MSYEPYTCLSCIGTDSSKYFGDSSGLSTRDLRELATLLLGFMPCLLFLFLSGHTLTSLERAIIVCLIASLTFGFIDLRRGFILQCGTLLFFFSCLFLVNVLKVIWVAKQMDILANSFLACLIWLTVVVGKPFALQYARRDLPKEQWNDVNLIRGCRFITVVWGALMTFAVCVSVFKRTSLRPSRIGFTSTSASSSFCRASLIPRFIRDRSDYNVKRAQKGNEVRRMSLKFVPLKFRP